MRGSDQESVRGIAVGALLAASLHALAHPPWAIWPAAVLAPAPIAFVLARGGRGPTRIRAAVLGVLFASLAAWLTAASWALPSARDAHGSAAAAYAVVAALPLSEGGFALFYGAAFALAAPLARFGPVASVLGIASLWSAAEIARAALAPHGDWAGPAAALAEPLLEATSATRPLAAWIGSLAAAGGAALSDFVAIAFGCALGVAWAGRRAPRHSSAALVTAVVVVALASVASSLARGAAGGRAQESLLPLRVGIVQAGVARDTPWNTGAAARSFERYLELSRSDALGGAELIAWPAGSIPGEIASDAASMDELRALARERSVAIVAGVRQADGSDAVLFVSGDGAEHPDAQTLAAVGKWRLAAAVESSGALAESVATGLRRGADLLVLLADDSTIDYGAGPAQHFAAVSLLAVGSSRPLLRVATTGISAVVADDGSTAWRLPDRENAVASVEIHPSRSEALALRGGATGAMVFVLVAAACAALLPRLVPRFVGEGAEENADV